MTTPQSRSVVPPDFDAAYRASEDPWSVAASWYERRKLALTIAALPRERYRTAWEPGCGPGFTTLQIAERVDNLVATDASRVAVDAATRRLADHDHVEVRQSELPDVPLTHPVDLVIATEFLYYIEDWETAVDVLWSAVRPGGNLVLVHWAHHPHDAYRSGRAMHAMIAFDAVERGAQGVVTHTESDFTLDIYQVSA